MSDDLDRALRNLNRIKAAAAGQDAPSSPIVKQVVFGTDPSCDVVVRDEYASKRHCAFNQHENGTVTVEDLGSTNGTTVRPDGTPWMRGTRVYAPTPIGPGVTVRIGRTDLPWNGT